MKTIDPAGLAEPAGNSFLSTNMILITGAAGKTGNAVIHTLALQNRDVRALVFRAEHIQKVKALGAQEVAIGDMRNENVVKKAMQGIESVYHICPNMHPDEIVIGDLVIEAARYSGVQHFIYHSVLHPQIEAMPHHWHKMRVEERLFESNLPYTILQPTAYMQNIMANWGNIVETGRYPVPYAVNSCISMVDLQDVALVAGVILTEDQSNGYDSKHIGATYELVGTPAISQINIAAILSEKLGKPVEAITIPREIWERDARSSGLSDFEVDTLVRMFEYYERCGFKGSNTALSFLLSRPVTSFESFVQRTIERLL